MPLYPPPTTPAPSGPTVDAVIDEIAAAEASREYAEASVERVRATIRLAAITARAQILGQIMAEAGDTLLSAPGAADALTAGLRAADDESRRLLLALGVDVNAAEKGDSRG
jgi:hypothetical protein